MRTPFLKNLDEHQAVMQVLGDLAADVERIGVGLAQAIAAGGKLFFCGNGGSAAAAQHLAAEMTGKFLSDRRPLPGIALGTDLSALTSIANDYAFDQVFSRQLQALARPGDALVCLSTTGRSANLLMAAKTAKACGLQTFGLLGGDGGPLRPLCDDFVLIPSASTARVQEAHLLVAHSWCEHIEIMLGLGE